MQINIKHNWIDFKDLKYGDTFECDGLVFLKIPPHENNIENAVALSETEKFSDYYDALCFFADSEKVIKADFKMIEI